MLYLLAMPTPTTDISKSAVSILESADIVVCERRSWLKRLVLDNNINISGQILEYFSGGIDTKVVSALSNGKSVALIPDDGFPCVQDLGYFPVKWCIENNVSIKIIPNVSAITNAYILSGWCDHPYVFMGMLDNNYKMNDINLDGYVQIYFVNLDYLDSAKELLDRRYGSDREVVIIKDYGMRSQKIFRNKLGDTVFDKKGSSFQTIVISPR